MIQKYPPKNQKMPEDLAVLLQRKAGWEKTCNALTAMSAEGKCRLYGLGDALDKDDLPKRSNSPEARAAEFRGLLEEGILRTAYAVEDVLTLVADYRRIRRTRNRINHAGNIKSTETSMNRREVDRWLGDCLDRIKSMQPIGNMKSEEMK